MLVWVGLLGALLVPSMSSAQQCVQGTQVNCGDLMRGAADRACTATVQCTLGMAKGGYLYSYDSSGVQGCSPTYLPLSTATFVISASAINSETGEKFCEWKWRISSLQPARGPATGILRIDNADGLPVELMGFSIDGPAQSSEEDEPQE